MFRSRLRRAASCSLAAFVVLCSTNASAKLSKPQREELQSYVEKLQAVQDAEAQQAVIYLRGLLSDSAAKKDLVALRTNEDARTRLSANLALVVADEKKAPQWAAEELLAQGGIYGLLRLAVAPLEDDDELEIIKVLLKDAKPDVRQDVFRYLAEQRGKLFESVVARLSDKDQATRAAAAQALVAAGRADVLDEAQKLMGSKDEAVRREALDLAIVFTRDPATLAAAKKLVEKALADPSDAIRERAARRLVELNDASGRQVLLDVASKKTKPEEVAPILEFMLEHDARPKLAAVEPWLASEDANVKRVAHQLAAASGDKKFVDKLLEMYASTEFDDRLLAVQSLGRTSDPRALPPLQSSLFEMREDMRAAAARSLREYAKADALAALKRSLEGEQNKAIQLTVIDAIGAVGGADALQILRFQVTNSDIDYKKHIIEAIRATGMKQGAKALDVLLRDRNTEVQWRAFLATLALDESLAKPHFTTMFRNPPANFLADIEGLDPARRDAVHAYLLKQGAGSMRAGAAQHAMKTGTFDKELYEIALDATADSSLRRDLIHHFGNRGSKNDLAVLERLARGKDPSIARLSAWMLTRHPSSSLEASYRGYLGSKDEVLSAIAAYGLGTVWK